MDFSFNNHLYIPTILAIQHVMTFLSTASMGKKISASINNDAFWYGDAKMHFGISHTQRQTNRLVTDNQADGRSDKLTTRLITGEKDRR